MEKEQLYLLFCSFLVRADLKNTERLVRGTNSLNRKDAAEALCVLWPELDDPKNFAIIMNCLTEQVNDCEGILPSLLNGDENLIATVEMDPDTITSRYHALKGYVEATLEKYDLTVNIDDEQFSLLKARVIICNLVHADPLFYKSVWNSKIKINQSFEKWVSGILKPLAHFNKRSNHHLSISTFEGLTVSNILNLFWRTSETVTDLSISILRPILTYEIIPYIQFSHSYEEFLAEILNVGDFPLDTMPNYHLFKHMVLEMGHVFPDDLRASFEKQILSILYENGANISKVIRMNVSNEFISILSSLQSEISLANTPDVLTLKFYAEHMDTLQIYNLKDIYKLSQGSELAQKSYFSSVCKNVLGSTLTTSTLEELISLTDESYLFVKISKETKESIIIETLLNLGQFDLLHNFMARSTFHIEDSVLLKYFWRFFNNASNGSRLRPEIVKARKTLELLPEGAYDHLNILLEVADQLSQFSLSFTKMNNKKLPFKPSHIIELKNQPFDIITNLLSSNQGLYKDFKTTTEILKRLYGGLEITPSTPDFYNETSELLSLHIDFALGDMDFEFAYQKSSELLGRKDCRQFWSTVFQVGKFFDPNWPENEIPTEIIYLQLEILSKLLHICPEEEVEAVVSQWSGLEMELASRDIVNDKFSLSNNRSSKEFQQKIVQEVSSSVSNFLSSGFKWAIGDDAYN
ncbi:LAFE_0A02146g1_1 [Lachancea fermentati]|uniref:LAFE_0A02146g1_1 n=1 Tax=Lachancea fermentati TaxID=4955 RepID=A0A1G4M6E0_LACFM|nr:LAFE_0A02146g1_1 [Lachancea fermentati]